MAGKGPHDFGGGKIVIRGARTHNLKGVDLELPRNQLIVFTGLSGSGKSSLAFDTIFAEGQRRYVESLSSYARQFLRQMQKPDVDEISGLTPAISIDQKTRSNNPRSTVATITEIYDYLRVLYARVGRPHCLKCGRPIEKLSPSEIVALVRRAVGGKRRHGSQAGVIRILAPLVRGRKGEYYQLLYDLLNRGYETVVVDGRQFRLRERIVIDKNKKHNISLLVDELKRGEVDERLAEALERALGETEGLVEIEWNGKMELYSTKFACPVDGFSYPEVEPRLFSFNSPYGACETCHGLGTKHFLGEEPCLSCRGERLRPEALGVRLGTEHLNIAELVARPVGEVKKFFDELDLTEREITIAAPLRREIGDRLQFLLDVGLDYLTLNRRAHTLSGGESQRIRLASQLGSRLVGTLYVLDEPTIGLHPRDTTRLVKTLEELRDLGNTIIVVEHDEETILASDYLVDIGPGAGVHGGRVVVAAPTSDLLNAKQNKFASLTVDYLRGERLVPRPRQRRERDHGRLEIRGGQIYNLKDLDVNVPLGRLVAVTGVSGSGKSSFVYEIIYRNLRARLERRWRDNQTYNCRSFSGTENLTRVILIDQSPIGRTPRSNPVTYTGAFSYIRNLFAATEEARVRGWTPRRFSFNVRGGRCETCQGNGLIAVEMNFLPTVYVECDVCRGRRFDRETLNVRYQGKTIADVLRLTVEEAREFFADIAPITDRLRTLEEVGLGYLELGQSATTLSGGEAQRIKIAAELYRPQTYRTIYLLDEPTVGLHYEDVRHLMEILHRLVDRGNSVLVIEHNLDVIKNADYIIDLGPEGGSAGGEIVVAGAPEAVANHSRSHTGHFLKTVLKKND